MKDQCAKPLSLKGHVAHAGLLFILGFMVGLCYLAFQGGRQERYQQEWKKAPLSQVLGTGWCDGSGQPWYATYYLYEPNVLTLHCTEGLAVTAPRR